MSKKKLHSQIYNNLKQAMFKEIGTQLLAQTLSNHLFLYKRKPNKLHEKVINFASKSEGHSILASVLFGHHYYSSYMPKALANMNEKIRRNFLLNVASNIGTNLYNLSSSINEGVNKITDFISHYAVQYGATKNIKNPKLKQFVSGFLETFGAPRVEQVKRFIAPFIGIASLPFTVAKLKNMENISEEQLQQFVIKMHQGANEPYDIVDKVKLMEQQQLLTQGKAPKR